MSMCQQRQRRTGRIYWFISVQTNISHFYDSSQLPHVHFRVFQLSRLQLKHTDKLALNELSGTKQQACHDTPWHSVGVGARKVRNWEFSELNAPDQVRQRAGRRATCDELITTLKWSYHSYTSSFHSCTHIIRPHPHIDFRSIICLLFLPRGKSECLNVNQRKKHKCHHNSSEFGDG